MVDNSSNLCKSSLGWFFRQWVVRHLHQLPRVLILLPHLASTVFKRKLAARGKKAPHVSSIVGSFSPQPLRESIGGSVAPDGCPLVLAAAPASPAVLREDGQNGRTPATTPGGSTDGESSAPWPRFDEPTQLSHGGWSDSPAQ